MARSSLKRKIFSSAQARSFDLRAQKNILIPSLLLMENAGRSVAEEALKMLGGKERVTILCGAGNNGGDGLVAARHLLAAGKKVRVLIFGSHKKLKTDPRLNLKMLQRLGLPVVFISSIKKIPSLLVADLIIDALFGIGLDRKLNMLSIALINRVNQSGVPVLAVDLPSGLQADTGEIMGVVIRAERTVTFVAPKSGFFRGAGPQYCGKIVVKNIGLPNDCN
jgi:NAD(P)H-hydrate epimerase